MTIKYGKLEMPESIDIEEESATPTFARFVASPFERGFGHTIGNSLRRMLLSSLEAPAIISVRMEGVPHEYMAIDGIVEDMTYIILNFKSALLRKLPTEEEPGARDSRIHTVTVEVTQEQLDKNKGQKIITLGDVISSGSFEVINPDLRLFAVTKPLKMQIDLRIAFGRGYVPSERHFIRDLATDEIIIDSSFSPIRLANYYVENTRIGQDTDYDRLIIEVRTDGRITPSEAVAFASQLCLKQFDIFSQVESHVLTFDQGPEEGDADQDEIMEKLSLQIDEIELSVRSTNCLKGANIDTIVRW